MTTITTTTTQRGYESEPVPVPPPVTKAAHAHDKTLKATTEWILPDYFTQFSAELGKPLALRLGTFRSLRGKLQTTLGVCTVADTSVTHRMGHDYWTTLEAATVPRITERLLLVHHNRWREYIQGDWANELDTLARHYENLAAKQ